tara:strand:+ start:606 stop:3776 length:3171 start_codon:yes stop_codon:yes gene_type:complete
MGKGTKVLEVYKYATEIIDPNAQKLHDDIEQLLNDLNRERTEASKVAGEKGETISTDLVKFDTKMMKKLLKEMEKRGIKYGYNRETIERYYQKKMAEVKYSPEESISLIKESLKYLEGGDKINVEAVDGLLRFDITKVNNKDYVDQYKKQMVAIVEEIYKQKATGDKTLKSLSRSDLLDLASELGHVDTFVSLLNKPTGESFSTAAEAINAVMLREAYEIELSRLSKAVNSGKGIDNFNYEQTKIKLYDTIETAKILLPKIYAAQSESGRILQAQSGKIRNLAQSKTLTEQWQIAAGKGEYEQELAKIFTDYDKLDDVADFAKNYVALPKQKRPNFVSKSTWSKVKNRVNSLYVHSLLGSPETQMRNIFNNSFKQAFHFVQQPVATTIYKAGKLVEDPVGTIKSTILEKNPNTVFIDPLDEDGMYFLDYYIEAIAEQNAFKHAIRNAQDVFKNNEAIDMTQKLSNAERNTFKTSKEIDEGEGSSLYKNGMKVYNNLQTAAGRGLMTADEFFATMSFNRTLMVLAFKRANNIYAKTGKIEDAQREFIKTLTDFDPEDIDGAGKALDIAGQDRFVVGTEPDSRISRWLQRNSDKLNHPVVKWLIPMRRVFSEMMRQSVELTPGAGFLTKRMRDDLAAGGSRRANALAKQYIAVNTVLMTAELACGLETPNATFCITGSNPPTQRGKDFWAANNLSNYGFFHRDNVNEPWRKVMSYELAMPFSIPLALGANLGLLTQMSDPQYDENYQENMATWISNSSMILAPYVETSAFIQPILTITDDLAKLAVYEDKVDRAGALLGEFVDDYGANVVQQSIGGITTSPSMLKFIERSFDPQSYVNIPPEYDTEWVQSAEDILGVDLDQSETTFYNMINTTLNGIPGVEDRGKVGIVNYRGEKIQTEYSLSRNMVQGIENFFGIEDQSEMLSQFTPRKDETLLYFAKNNLESPNTILTNYHIRRKLGVRLEASEYLKYRDIMSGTKIVYKDFADRDMFDGQELTLSEALDKLVADGEFRRLPSKSENFNGKQDVLENIYKQITDRAVNELVRGEGGADLARRIANK